MSGGAHGHHQAERGKSPSLQWYPKDWLQDAALQLCSLYARGLWHEMLLLMWSGDPPGHLAVAGRPMTEEQLARAVREPRRSVRAALAELENSKVFSKNDAGIIVSRRMLRDLKNREIWAEFGKQGAEHGKKGAEFGIRGGRPRTVNADENREPRGPLGNWEANSEPCPPGGFGNSEEPPSKPPTSSSSSSSSASALINQREVVVVLPEIGKNDDDDRAALGEAAEPPAEPITPKTEKEAEEAVIGIWNEVTHRARLPELSYATAKRRAAARELLGWYTGTLEERLDAIRRQFMRIAASDYCCGKGRDGWRATFEWACDPDNAAKVLEGRYFDLRGGKGGRR